MLTEINFTQDYQMDNCTSISKRIIDSKATFSSFHGLAKRRTQNMNGKSVVFFLILSRSKLLFMERSPHPKLFA